MRLNIFGPKKPRTVAGERRFLNQLSILCAGAALVCDGYQNSLMTAINIIFAKEYPKAYDAGYTTRVSNAMTVGQIIGMLVMGLIADLISRRSAVVTTTSFMVVGGILAAAAHGKTTHGMFWMVAVMRGVIGFGVGGEFPTSSAITIEAAEENPEHRKNNNKKRGRLFSLIVNIPLQMGGPLCMSVFLIVWEAAGGLKHLSTIWRVMFGIGCVWPVLVFLLRFRLVTSDLFRSGKFLNYRIPWLLAFKFYKWRLIGTCGSFFLYDMIVFPNGIFSSLILKSVVKNGDIKKTAEWQLLLGALTIPGVIVGALICEKLGRKRTMMVGFLGFVVFGVAIGCSFKYIKEIVPLFVVMYGLFQAVGHMGPGTMMGLITTESYATGVRASFYGLSLAFGRAGGAVGTQVFNPIKIHLGQEWTFIISAIIGGVAIVFVWLFIPNLDSRDLDDEDAEFMKYLRANGYTGSVGFTEFSDDEGSDYEEAKEKTVVTTSKQVDAPADETLPTSSPESGAYDIDAGSSMHADGHEPKTRRLGIYPDSRTFWQRVFSLEPLAT